jgi:hypothetical protein
MPLGGNKTFRIRVNLALFRASDVGLGRMRMQSAKGRCLAALRGDEERLGVSAKRRV